jgi:hypothetical protein
LEDDVVPSNSVAFVLKSSDDLVVLNGVVTSLGQLINDKSGTDEKSAKVAYHTMKVDSHETTKFTLAITHRVTFTCQPETATDDIKPFTFASRVTNLAEWSNDITEMIWMVRWTNKGLTPIKPAVYLSNTCELGPGRAIVF